ncbi:MAG: peroxiredoxin [Zetaproteobacteria bacterium]|nr:MAG: peroxiredoxin [Zetaproteobacteria bacterium]
MAAFQRAQDKLREERIAVVAASIDPREKAAETVETLSLTFPVGYDLPMAETAGHLGAFYETRRGILQATGFVVNPDRRIAVAQYSSGPIGRLVWQDVLGLIRLAKTSAS